MNKTCILLQTNDDYEFLWEGLYLSWKLNWLWEKFNLPVYVITETKDFKSCHPTCSFETINVGGDLSGRSNYSSKLLKGLDFLQNKGYENLIYCLDDSWPETAPDSLMIDGIYKMFNDENLDVFYFHEHRPHFPFTLRNVNKFIEGRRVREFYGNSRFYYNLGCGIWKIDSLKKIQNHGESPYQNERLTTSRCWEMKIKAYFLNYPWYNQDLIHEKGNLKETAHEILNRLSFRLSWEYKQEFMFNYIACDGSIIPILPDDPSWQNMTEDEINQLYNSSFGYHFSNYTEL